MGIRFTCPNGHKLNVKAEFAGRRAKCPKCEVSLVVPQPADPATASPATASPTSREPGSTERGSTEPRPTASGASETLRPTTESDPAKLALPQATQSTPEVSASPSTPTPTPTPQPSSPAAAFNPAAAPSETTWYVRAVTGEQFGPADTPTMQQWIAEGRVAADSWTWRTGWEDWQPGATAIAQLDQAPPVQPAAAMEAAVSATAGPAIITEIQPASTEVTTEPTSVASSAAARRQARERKKKRNKIVTLVLGVLTLVLSGVLMWILYGGQAGTKSKQSSQPPKPTTENASKLAAPQQDDEPPEERAAEGTATDDPQMAPEDQPDSEP